MNLLAYPVLVGIQLLGVVCDAKAMLQLETNKDYEGAVQQCIENEGHLVLPLNETQNMELARLLPRRGRAWLYLYSPYGLITQPSVMEQMTFVNWMGDHPNPSKGMCVRIKNNGNWESADCYASEIVVCTPGPRPQTPSTLLPKTETNEPDDNNPGSTSAGNATMRPHIETSSIAPAHRDASLSSSNTGPTSEENATMRPHMESSSIAPTHRDASSNTGAIIGATMVVLAVIAALIVGVYIMRRRSVSRSSSGGDETLCVENKVACNTYEEIVPSFMPDIKDPGVGQSNGYTSVNLDSDNAITHFQALHSPGTDANDVTSMVQDNDLYSPGTDENDVSPMVQDNDLHSPGIDANDVSAVVQDNDLYSLGTDANDVSAVVQDNDLYSLGTDANDVSAVIQNNDLYSPGTDAEAVNAMITESSHGFDRNVDGISMADNELYSSENDSQMAPVYLEILPLQGGY